MEFNGIDARHTTPATEYEEAFAALVNQKLTTQREFGDLRPAKVITEELIIDLGRQVLDYQSRMGTAEA